MINYQTTKKIAAECSRILIGVVFIFSGIVKAIDPMGGEFKFQDYFSAFGFDMLQPFTLMFSFSLSALEFTLGVCILLGVYRRYATLLVLVLMLFMTPFTFYLALFDPVSDCGCFGDALVISNWETFFKNVVLLAASIILFIYNQKLLQAYTFKVYWFVALYAYVFCFAFAFINYTELPIIDFRPYKVGVNIPDAMSIPANAPQSEEKYAFIYEKDGVKKEFSLDNYPEGDSTWTFVEQKVEVIKPGYIPPINNFSITNTEGNDITDSILQNTKGVFLLISSKLEKANDADIEQINNIYDFAAEENIPFYCLTASDEDQIKEWRNNTGAEYPFCFTDETTLKTIIRSNPGLVLIKDGTILQKWSHNDLPEEEQIENVMNGYLSGKTVKQKEDDRLLTNLLSFTLPLLLVWIYDLLRNRRKSKKKEN